MSLSLSGWRQRSYPIRISVDGQEVYRGRTQRSLDYVTLPLKPLKGKSVKVELVDAPVARDASNVPAEVGNQQHGSTGDERQGSSTLIVVEFECCEAAAK